MNNCNKNDQLCDLQDDCGDSSEKQDSGSAGLEEQGVGLDEHEGGEVEVEIVVTFKEDRKVIQAKESTTIGKIKEKLAMYYKKNCEGPQSAPWSIDRLF